MAPLVEGIFPTLAGRSNISRQCRVNRKQRNDEHNYEHAASHQNSLVEGAAVLMHDDDDDADDLWKGNSAVVTKG